MSNVPSFMSQGQILSPDGLQATLKLFQIDDKQSNVYLYSHAEESGGTPIKSNRKRGRHESDVDGDYQATDHYHMDGANLDGEGSVYCDWKVTEDDVMSISEASESDNETVDTDSRNESDSDDESMGQGGASVYVRPMTGGLRLPSKKAEKKPKMVIVVSDSESSESESEDYEAGCMRRQREREQKRRKDLDNPVPFPKFGTFSTTFLGPH